MQQLFLPVIHSCTEPDLELNIFTYSWFEFIYFSPQLPFPLAPTICFLWRLLNTASPQTPTFLIDKCERWCSKWLKTNHLLLPQVLCAELLNFTSTPLLGHGHQNDSNDLRIVLPRCTGMWAAKASHPAPIAVDTNKYCTRALHRQPVASSWSRGPSLLCLTESSPTGMFLFHSQAHLFILRSLLKQAKQFRAFWVKCLLPSDLTFCHSLCYLEMKQQ